MHLLKAAFCSALVFITLSGQTLYADGKSAGPQPLFAELLKNMPFYLEYVANSHRFYWDLSKEERARLELLRQYLNSNMPFLTSSLIRENFFLQKDEPERIAKTTNELHSSIDFNTELLAKHSVDIALGVQLLLHELGHKLNDFENQGVIDSLATKIALYFKSYTQELKISEQESLHILSLPIQWFHWRSPSSWYMQQLQQRPNTALFLKKSNSDFQSLTEPVLAKLESAIGSYQATWRAQNDVFTDAQAFFYGLEPARDGKVSIFVRDQRKLQPVKEPKRFSFPEEEFSKTITHEQQVLFDLSSGEIQVRSTDTKDFSSSVRTALEQSGGVYRLTLPDLKSENLKLRLSTAQGPILLSPEKIEPLTFNFQIPTAGTAEFVEIHSAVNDKNETQFLDKAYWFPVSKSTPTEAPSKIQNIQMQVDGEWREAKADAEEPFFNRWGQTELRLQLPQSKKIRQIRFVWEMYRRHFKSTDLQRPQFYQPFGPTQFVVHGNLGREYAVEKDIYEDIFSEKEFTQEDQQIAIPLKLEAKHITSLSFTNISHRIGRFFKLTSNITYHEIRGEDSGSRRLLDILITDENLETTSILSAPLRFRYSRLSCEELMKEARRRLEQFE